MESGTWLESEFDLFSFFGHDEELSLRSHLDIVLLLQLFPLAVAV